SSWIWQGNTASSLLEAATITAPICTRLPWAAALFRQGLSRICALRRRPIGGRRQSGLSCRPPPIPAKPGYLSSGSESSDWPVSASRRSLALTHQLNRIPAVGGGTGGTEPLIERPLLPVA